MPDQITHSGRSTSRARSAATARVIGGAVALALSSAPAVSVAQIDPPSPATIARNHAAAATLPASDQDRDFATRGFIGTRKDPLIRNAAGDVVWNLDAYAFANGPAPDTVNPSLWRHTGLLARHGLFKVADHVYQVRGFDLANITFVEGKTGWIVIDTLTSAETAVAAYELVSDLLGRKPIAAVVITHSHSDHFGGAVGLLAHAAPGQQVPVLAPAGFFREAVSENVIAGPAMNRRAIYQFGTTLGAGPTASAGSGIGVGIAGGTRGLPRPTKEIDRDGEEMTIDGVRIRFQLTPGTEAPAEMNVAFPDWHLIDLAENANVTQHNILTPRGAQVRDTRAWVDGLTRTIARYPDAEVMMTSHGWPRFGRAAIQDFLARQRDAYAYLHDQTVRLMNLGLTGDDIAARLALPPSLAGEWYNRPYYGSVSFNARAVYQFYLGWYDGNPAHLAAMAPAEAGARYVAAMGGAAKVLETAGASIGKGDYAWAAELLDRLVMSGGGAEAKALLARCYQQMAWQSENSLWRNMYLSAAADLLASTAPAAGGRAVKPANRAGYAEALTLDEATALMATRLDPAKAAEATIAIAFEATDTHERTTVHLEHGVLVREVAGSPRAPDATLSGPRARISAALVAGAVPDDAAAGGLTITGDRAALTRLLAMLEAPSGRFPIVLPR